MLNTLSRNTLSKTVLLGKSFNLHEPHHVESRLYLVGFDKCVNLPCANKKMFTILLVKLI